MATPCKVLQAVFMVPHFPRDLPNALPTRPDIATPRGSTFASKIGTDFDAGRVRTGGTSQELRLRCYEISRPIL